MDTMMMIDKIIHQSSLAGLMREMNREVMHYMGFTDINIMFHDAEKNILYTITFGDDDEKKMRLEIDLKNASSEKERQYILDKEAIRDVMLEGNRMIFYPVHIGITRCPIAMSAVNIVCGYAPPPTPGSMLCGRSVPT